jgi:hypothetical protein
MSIERDAKKDKSEIHLPQRHRDVTQKLSPLVYFPLSTSLLWECSATEGRLLKKRQTIERQVQRKRQTFLRLADVSIPARSSPTGLCFGSVSADQFCNLWLQFSGPVTAAIRGAAAGGYAASTHQQKSRLCTEQI